MDEEEIKPEIRKHFRPYQERGAPNVQGCWDPDGFYQDIFRDIGEVWRNPTECNRKTCTRDGTIIEEVCPEPVVPEGCLRIKGLTDNYQDFPYCCDHVACPGDDEYWEDNPNWPEQCDDKYCVRDIGEEWSEHKYGICNKKRCARNKYNKAEIFEEACPEVEVPKGCKLEAYPDLTKEFPDCCPKVVCPRGHPANKNGDSTNDKTETLTASDNSATGTGKGADDNQVGSRNTAKSANGSKRKGEKKKTESETINRGVTLTSENVMNTKEANRNSYKEINITEMFKNGTVTLFEKGKENRNPIKPVQSNTEATNKNEHASKQKKTKTERTTVGISDVKGENEKSKRRGSEARKNRVEDTVTVNESGGEQRKQKYQSRHENKIKARTAKKRRRKGKAKKKVNPLGNIDLRENQDMKVKTSEKTKRTKKKKSKGKKEGEEDLLDKLSEIIKPTEKYI